MAESIDNLTRALGDATANRPAVQGFPFFAETLRRAGVRRTEWTLPSMQSLYLTDLGPVVMTGRPLVDGASVVHPFDEKALVAAIRGDQAGELAFPQFALGAWRAGVIQWTVDLDDRVCTYRGLGGESFEEAYPGVSVPATPVPPG